MPNELSTLLPSIADRRLLWKECDTSQTEQSFICDVSLSRRFDGTCACLGDQAIKRSRYRVAHGRNTLP